MHASDVRKYSDYPRVGMRQHTAISLGTLPGAPTNTELLITLFRALRTRSFHTFEDSDTHIAPMLDLIPARRHRSLEPL